MVRTTRNSAFPLIALLRAARKSAVVVRAHRECRTLHDRDRSHHPARRQYGFYAPARDVIQLPPFEAFKDKESYYATALHELTHNADTRIMPRWT
jgi:Zincin-like metallopeptidase